MIPEAAPAIKEDMLKGLGASVIRYGSSYDEAYEHAKRFTREQGGLFKDVSDPESVALMGTAVHDGLSRRDVDVVILQAGRGTLASAAQVVRDFKEWWHLPNTIKVIIACAELAPTVAHSFVEGRVVTVPAHTRAADAANVSTVDAHLLPVIKKYADDVVLVSEESIRQGVALLSDVIGIPVEGTGVLGAMAVIASGGVLRGATGYIHDIRGLNVLTFATGGNVDRSSAAGQVVGESDSDDAPPVPRVAALPLSPYQIEEHRPNSCYPTSTW
ncbi:MAG: pyridoxal-phosphate dependent enzyme [Mycobacterium sp.]|nr:pyridoxal-phosphate dependent enzyme [Mycobacterium sp.]